jgi:hypothetical protein
MEAVMAGTNASQIIEGWPEGSREAAQLVIEHGEPDEATESALVWHRRGHWKRILATKVAYLHNFPMLYMDSVESFIDYRVPIDKFTPLAQFDGSVITERTAGEASARCHDLEANCLALNLMHDLVTGAKNVQQAREYYKKEVLDYRRKLPTPYMLGLRFTPQSSNAGDADVRIISDAELKRALEEGKANVHA